MQTFALNLLLDTEGKYKKYQDILKLDTGMFTDKKWFLL